MAKIIDYYFSPGSPWAFLGLDPLVELARSHDAAIEPYPITIIAENGAISSKDRPRARQNYWFRDLKRWSVVRGRPLIVDNRPALSDPTPASLSIVAAHLDSLDWIGLTRGLQSALWQHAEDIGRPEVRARVAAQAGFDGDALVGREGDADVQARWNGNLARARGAGIFGSPTYVLDGEPYWGQDSLPFVERHLEGRPLLGT